MLVEHQKITLDARVKKRKLDEEDSVSITDDRRKKHCDYKDVAEALGSSNERVAQSLSDGFEQMPAYANYGSGVQYNNSSGIQHNNSGTGNQNSGSGQQYIGANHIGMPSKS
jgi:hypothetical protein